MIAPTRGSGFLFLRPASGLILFPTGPDSTKSTSRVDRDELEMILQVGGGISVERYGPRSLRIPPALLSSDRVHLDI
jgi:hypothetical protein